MSDADLPSPSEQESEEAAFQRHEAGYQRLVEELREKERTDPEFAALIQRVSALPVFQRDVIVPCGPPTDAEIEAMAEWIANG